MKSNILLSLISATLLLSGCGNEESDLTQTENTTNIVVEKSQLRGSATLANATLCLDLNRDAQCDADEPQTQTQNDGSYTLTLDSPAIEGDRILSTGGDNLILDEKNKQIKIMTTYHEGMQIHNISTLTTLVAQSIENGKEHSDAVAYIADRYKIESTLIEENPLDSLHDEEKQLHYFATLAMEKYYLQQVNNNTLLNAPQKSAGLNLGFISFDQAQNALDYFDIFSQNVQRALYLALLLGNSYLNDFLEYLGVKSSGDNYDFPQDVAVSDLNPTLTKVYNDTLRDITREEQNALVLQLQESAVQEKLYKDIETIYNSSDVDSKKIFLSSLVAAVDDERATQSIVLMMRVPTEESSAVKAQLVRSILALVRNASGEINSNNSNPLYNYILQNPEGEYATTAASAVFKIGVHHTSFFLLELLQEEYSNNSFLPTMADGIKFTVADIRSETATKNVLYFYEDTKSTKEYKDLLRHSLSEIANELAINKLYEIAATIDDSSIFYKIIAEFQNLQRVAPAATTIINSRLKSNDISFASENLREEISAIFAQ